MTRISLLFIVGAAVFTGLRCGGSPETTQTAPPQPQAPPPAPDLAFETRQDTVVALNAPGTGSPSAETLAPQIRFMVQIGAFRDPKLASAVQTRARERFHLPVLNDYHTQLALYQVRIGFFETNESAQEFRRKMQTEYPLDYSDSWIVRLKD
jgi:cell division protein FtsN